MPADYTDDLRLAHVLADDADSLTMDRFRALDLHVVTKPDLTPVSDADQLVEDALRAMLGRVRPRDAVLGEESGASGWGPRRWVIDPIDGTKSFIRGVPIWATLIGLMIEDEVVAGVVSAPALGYRWWASKGGGAWTGKSLHAASPCRVSDVTSIEDAHFSYASLTAWDGRERFDRFLRLARQCWRTRAVGDFWSYMLVADGGVDIAAEPELQLHDMAALSVIVDEAGGRFTSLDGTPGPSGGSALATNGRLHALAMAFLGTRDAGPPGNGHSGQVHDINSRRSRAAEGPAAGDDPSTT